MRQVTSRLRHTRPNHRTRNRVQFTLAVISQPRNEARAGPVLYPLLRATEWHETGIIFPYAAARGFRASRYKRLTCSNVHDLLLHFPRGGERCPLGLPFLMHSLPNQRDGSGTSVALRSVSGVLSFPNENRKSIIVKLSWNWIRINEWSFDARYCAR